MPRNKHFDPWIFSKKFSLKQLSQTLLNPKTKENQCLYNLAICIWLPSGFRSNFNYRNIRKWKQCLSSKTQAMSARSSIIHKTRLRCCCLYITVLQWYLNSQNFLRLANCSMLTFLFLFKVKKGEKKNWASHLQYKNGYDKLITMHVKQKIGLVLLKHNIQLMIWKSIKSSIVTTKNVNKNIHIYLT